MKYARFLFPILLGLPLGHAVSAELSTDQEKFSYTIGFQIGSGIKRDGLDVDADALTQAIKDVLSGSPAQLSREEMQAALQRYQDRQRQKQQTLAEENLQAGKDFLAANAKKAGVQQTDSGLQYKVLTKGDGRKPTTTDTVTVHYRGTLIDGTEFDSSYKRGQPTTFQLNGIIPGWQEALQLMPTGSKWQVYIPAELAYGAQGAGQAIGPNQTLIFDIELISIN